jgi:hypothetical protein
MKTLFNTFGNKENKKSMSNFSDILNINAMLLIKGGEGDPTDDLWPPTTDDGNNGAN